MSGTNQFQPFATGASANTLTPAAWAALSTLLSNGFQSGVASSQQMNTAFRQSTFMAAAIGQVIANAGLNANDDGNLANLAAAIKSALMGGMAGVNAISGATTLTVSNIGQTQVLSGSSAYTVTLPVASTTAAGAIIGFINIGTANVTVSRQNTDVIDPNATPITSIVVGPGDTLLLESNASGIWYAVEGSARLPYAAVMSGANFTTQAQLDNSTKLATTGFVKNAGVNFNAQLTYNSTTTLPASVVGGLVEFYGSTASQTLTLPLASSARYGDQITLINFATVPVTISRQSTDAIVTAGSNYNTIILGVGDSLILSANSGTWFVDGGSASLQYSNSFASSLAASGYQKLPSGLIVQWGRVSTNNTGVTTSFPITFPNAFCSMTAIPDAQTTSTYYVSVGDGAGGLPTTSQFKSYINATSLTNIAWIAIGY